MRIFARKIAVVRLGAIGDTVNCLPFVNRLRAAYPEAHLSWVIGPKAHALLRGHPAVDEFVLFDARRPASWPKFVRELRARRFDLVIDLQRITKSGLVTRATGCARRLGFDRARCKEASWIWTNLKIPPNPRPGVTVEQYLEFADYLELPRTEPEWKLSFVPFDASAGAGATTPGTGRERDADDRPRIVLNLGASRPSKLWYADAWARLAELCVHELGASVHLSGGREDRAIADLVVAAARVPIADHVGRASLPQTAGLIAGAAAFVGCDTGPTHIAAALGTPVIGLYGATNPRRSAPFGSQHQVVTHPVPCAPCMRRVCNVAGHPCMRDLAPEVVLEHVRAALTARAGARSGPA